MNDEILFAFTDTERAYHTEMRAISRDEFGRDVFVGLTHGESAELQTFNRRFLAGVRKEPEERKRYLELNDKHERVRLAVIGAEHQLRVDAPPRH